MMQRNELEEFFL